MKKLLILSVCLLLVLTSCSGNGGKEDSSKSHGTTPDSNVTEAQTGDDEMINDPQLDALEEEKNKALEDYYKSKEAESLIMQKLILDRVIYSEYAEKHHIEQYMEASQDQDEAILDAYGKKLEDNRLRLDELTRENDAIIQKLVNDPRIANVMLELQNESGDAARKKVTEAIETHGNSESSGDGEFMWPLETGIISVPFGINTLDEENAFHYGTDIACTIGVPVYASNSGKVILSDWDDYYGYFVLIDHGESVSTLYAQLSFSPCKVGQKVSKGDVIGFVGNSGYSIGSHLHFEYLIDGEQVDPEMYVSKS